MGFRLSGGRPKNMGQGIYWVQRNVADQRRASRAASAEANRIARHNAAAKAFNERYARITSNIKRFFDLGGEVTTSEKDGKKIHDASERYIAIKGAIDHNIDSASNADLNKLSTAARNFIIVFAKLSMEEFEWDSQSKCLKARGLSMDFR